MSWVLWPVCNSIYPGSGDPGSSQTHSLKTIDIIVGYVRWIKTKTRTTLIFVIAWHFGSLTKPALSVSAGARSNYHYWFFPSSRCFLSDFFYLKSISVNKIFGKICHHQIISKLILWPPIFHEKKSVAQQLFVTPIREKMIAPKSCKYTLVLYVINYFNGKLNAIQCAKGKR